MYICLPRNIEETKDDGFYLISLIRIRFPFCRNTTQKSPFSICTHEMQYIQGDCVRARLNTRRCDNAPLFLFFKEMLSYFETRSLLSATAHQHEK